MGAHSTLTALLGATLAVTALAATPLHAQAPPAFAPSPTSTPTPGSTLTPKSTRTPTSTPAATSTSTQGADEASTLESSEAWFASSAVQAQLAAGKVASQTVVDEQRGRASLDAAIRIHASPAAIWPLITQCRSAGLLIAGLKHCRVLQASPDGSQLVIEHDIKYSLLTPLVHSVFQADLQAPYRMDFHRIRGDLKYEVGTWILQPSADGNTTVEYRVAMQPGFWVPRSMVRHSLRKQLPAALVALRTAAEQSAAAPVAEASPPVGDSSDSTSP